MSEHNGKVIFDDSVAGRKWGVWCEQCRKIVAACVSEQEAKECLETHQFWQAAKAKFEERA